MQHILTQEQPYLTAQEVAGHFQLRPSTIRRWSSDGRIASHRIGRQLRFTWDQVWACENGPFPRKQLRQRYSRPLWTKRDVATLLSVSNRSVERWIERGLPTRNVYGAVRVNPYDARDWLANRFGIDLQLGTNERARSNGQ
ncbi:helix-turn-helix domain-containing protein [Roseivivax marinus]|uniref:helix-turn-helix domain-containing protein n=1 Tax=Roseivivax marinus TaxID=1379903 RepID=UPI00273DE9E5|nr:helix-turn-helix domain-containing protein [Roseivivax marinus]